MIYIANLQKKVRVPSGAVKKLVQTILRREKASDRVFSLAFVGDRRIRTLNRKFLRHDYVTDVLAFALGDPDQAGGVHGEIVISAEYAAREARKRGIPVRQELLRYVAHGVLHLLGYEDDTPRKKKKMWEKQERFLKPYSSLPK